MDNKSNKHPNKRKIFLNYFSNNMRDRPMELKLEDKEEKESSFVNINTRNRSQLRHMSVDKYIRNKSFKSGNKTYWADSTTNKSLSGTVQDNKKNINLNLNLNLNVTGPNLKNEKKIEDFLNNNFCKLDETKLSKIISKSPISNHSNILGIAHSPCNLVHYIKNTKYFRNHKLIDNLSKSNIIHNNTGQNLIPNNSKNHISIPVHENKKLNVNNSSSNIHINTSNNISKHCSLNTSFFNNKNVLKDSQQIKESPKNKTNDLIKDSSREKLGVLKEVLDLLKIKDKKHINKEVEKIICGYTRNKEQYGTNNCQIQNMEGSLHSHSLSYSASISNQNINISKVEKENKILKGRIEEIDKKFEVILRENKELKSMIKCKNEEFNRLHLEMNGFKKELKNIKFFNKKSFTQVNTGLTGLCAKNKLENHRHTVSINHNIFLSEKHCQNNLNHLGNSPAKEKTLTRSKSGGKAIPIKKNLSAKSSSTGIKKRIKEKDNSLDLSRLDTLDLITRAQIDDPKKVLYLPNKVNTLNKVDGCGYKIPKLDISMAMHELEEYDMLHAGNENGDQNQENVTEVQCDNPYLNSNILNTEVEMSYSKDIIENEIATASLNITNNDKLNEAFCSEKYLKDINESGSFNTPDKKYNHNKNFKNNNSEHNVNTVDIIFEQNPEKQINKIEIDKLDSYHKDYKDLNVAYNNELKISLDNMVRSNNIENKRNSKNEIYDSNNMINQSLNRNFLDFSNQNFFVNGTFDSVELVNPNERK